MATIKSFTEIVNSMLERLRLVQPNLDTKPGTVSRDLFIDLQADELQRIYRLISLVADKQSFATASGRDLDRLAGNFGVVRRTGTPATGIAIFTTSLLEQDVAIPSGLIVTARNGVSFRTVGNFSMLSTNKSRYASNANRLRDNLDVAGISDVYAIEVPVEATSIGTSGNISTNQLIETNSDFFISVTNVTSLSGGTDQESDSSFRTRFLSTFSGSNIGTSIGYRNAVLGLQGVLDALVVEPGNTLMLRDGTEVLSTENSTRILNSGTGGKVDIYVLGTALEEFSESFIFRNKSVYGKIDDDANDYILGYSNQDISLTSEERRQNAFKTGNLPFQPCNRLVSVSGSSSGVLTEASLLPDGTYDGNYILVKDFNSDTGGTPFGFDKIKFVSDKKIIDGEPIIKNGNNIIDLISFSDISNIYSIYQDILITSENSRVSIIDPSIIKLKHSPISAVRSVINSTTGEVYKVIDSGIDVTTGVNATNEIKISGKNLPTLSDKLKVSYTWRKVFDENKDYSSEYNLYYKPAIKDAVDWGGSNGILHESTILSKDSQTGAFSLDVDNQISSVSSVYIFEETQSTVILFDDVPAIDLSDYPNAINNIVSIKTLLNLEIFNTKKSDGSVNNKIIFLPSDSNASIGDSVNIILNKTELYDLENNDGTFNGVTIELPENSVLESIGLLEILNNAFFTEREVYVDYSADISVLIPSTEMSSLPILSIENSNSFIDSSLATIELSKQPLEYVFVNNVVSDIYRYSPSNIKIQTQNITSQGKIGLEGVSAERFIYRVFAGNTFNGRVLDLQSELKNNLGELFKDQLFISKLNSIKIGDKVIDINNYELKSNIYDIRNCKQNSELSNFQISLPKPSTYSSGTIIECDFYLSDPASFEELYFYTNEARITNKNYYTVNKINIISGFKNTANIVIGSIVVSQFNQPDQGNTYYLNYDFKAPRDGERITVNYNINNLIRTATSAIEVVRPVTADVLIKEAQEVLVDTSGTIVVSEDFSSDANSVVESVNNNVANLLNSGELGGLIDYSDVIQVVTGVAGVDSVNVSLFGYSGEFGRRTFVRALDNQTISPGVVSFTAVSRKNFKIT